MTENNNSFETVELLKHISLMPIDGSELTGINAETENTQAGVKAESGTAQVNAKNEAKTPQAPVEAAGKFADDTVSPYKHTDAENLMQMLYQIIAAYFEDDCADELTFDPDSTPLNTCGKQEGEAGAVTSVPVRMPLTVFLSR